MAKITLGKVSQTGFTNTMELMLGQKLPIRTAFKVKTLVGIFNEELKKFNDIRKEILERHCDKNEDGTPKLENRNYNFSPEKMLEVTKELNELSAIEVEFTPIKIDELGEISLTAQNLFDLGEVIDA